MASELKEISRVQDGRVTKRMIREPEIDINPDRNKWHQLFLELIFDAMSKSLEIGVALNLKFNEIRDKCTDIPQNNLSQVLEYWLKSDKCPEYDYLEALTKIYDALKSINLNTVALKVNNEITKLKELQATDNDDLHPTARKIIKRT
ncbi:MAG: hypothetical protein HAW66_06575 [Shewanella sp.]|nr:hypothetical protein [Shewanella sp.]